MEIIRIFDDDSDHLYLQGTAIIIFCFADDMLIMSASLNGLQASMNKLGAYCNRWNLEVNTEKTKALHIRKPGTRTGIEDDSKLMYNDQIIEWVQSFSYLGVEVTDKGHMQTLSAPIRKKAARAQFKLSRLVRSLSFDTKIWLHRVMVDPILVHGAEVWLLQNRCQLVKQYGIYQTYNDKGKRPIPGKRTKRQFIRIQIGAHEIHISIRNQRGFRRIPVVHRGGSYQLQMEIRRDGAI